MTARILPFIPLSGNTLPDSNTLPNSDTLPDKDIFLSPDKIPDAKKYKMYRYAQTFDKLPLEHCYRYVMSHLRDARLLVKFIPFPILVDLYTKHGYLREYLTQEWIDEILEHHQVLYISCPFQNSSTTTFTFSLPAKWFALDGKIVSPFIAEHFYLGAAAVSSLLPNTGNKIHEWVLYPKKAMKLRGAKILSKDYAIVSHIALTFTNTEKEDTSIKYIVYRKIVDIRFVTNYEGVCGDVSISSSTAPSNALEGSGSGSESNIINVYTSPFGYQALASNTLQNRESESNEEITDEKIVLTISVKSKNKPLGSSRAKLITKKCYMCNAQYSPKMCFSYYKTMCYKCATFNYSKQLEVANLNGCTAFVTGIRHTLGYGISIKLLRQGAMVVGTSRYPAAALYNYKQEPDYNSWSSRLIICQCDFLNRRSIEQTVDAVKEYKPNIFINNSSQTVRPTQQYYQEMNRIEAMLKDRYAIATGISSDTSLMLVDVPEGKQVDSFVCVKASDTLSSLSNTSIRGTLSSNATLSSNTTKEISIHLNSVKNVCDPNLDVKRNSWTIQLEDVPVAEILEVNIINQITPTLLLQSILPFMSKPAFVIQVTAKEGLFDSMKKYDEARHVHTNMCKAGFNMLIRSMMERPQTDVLYYSTDPGYVFGTVDKEYPLSIYDGAQRCIDPVIQYYLGKPLPQGLYKNYKPHDW